MGLAHVSIDKNDRKMMGLYITSDHWVQLDDFIFAGSLRGCMQRSAAM